MSVNSRKGHEIRVIRVLYMSNFLSNYDQCMTKSDGRLSGERLWRPFGVPGSAIAAGGYPDTGWRNAAARRHGQRGRDRPEGRGAVERRRRGGCRLAGRPAGDPTGFGDDSLDVIGNVTARPASPGCGPRRMFPARDGWRNSRTGRYGQLRGRSNWPACNYVDRHVG